MGNIFYVLNIACTALSQRKAASVAAFEAQLSNCYWANQHSSHSIPDGTEHCCTEETFLLPPFLHRHCKKMANKHWMPFLSHCFSLVEGITANICKSTTLFIFLGETILIFLLWVQTVRKSLVFGFAHCANQVSDILSCGLLFVFLHLAFNTPCNSCLSLHGCKGKRRDALCPASGTEPVQQGLLMPGIEKAKLPQEYMLRVISIGSSV